MDFKKRILKISIISFMVFIIVLSTSKTYAYWSNGVILTGTYQSNGFITVGEWNQVFEWDPNITYYAGDRVTYNGGVYEAKTQNTNIQPDDPGAAKYWFKNK